VKPLRNSYPASAEFADAVRWYEQKRIGLGGEFFDAVTHAIEFDRQSQRDFRSLGPVKIVCGEEERDPAKGTG
jgi:hypothetical protein